MLSLSDHASFLAQGIPAVQLFTPQPIQTFSDPWVSVRDRQVWPPRHYFMCTKDPNSHFRLIGPRFQNAPGWGYGEFDELHDVVRTHPQMVADAILKVADNWGLKPDLNETPLSENSTAAISPSA